MWRREQTRVVASFRFLAERNSPPNEPSIVWWDDKPPASGCKYPMATTPVVQGITRSIVATTASGRSERTAVDTYTIRNEAWSNYT